MSLLHCVEGLRGALRCAMPPMCVGVAGVPVQGCAGARNAALAGTVFRALSLLVFVPGAEDILTF